MGLEVTARKPGLGAHPHPGPRPHRVRESGTRTGQGLTGEQPERAPRDEEEGEHVGRRGPAWPRDSLPGPQPRSPQPQQSPRRRVFLAPAPCSAAPSPRAAAESRRKREGAPRAPHGRPLPARSRRGSGEPPALRGAAEPPRPWEGEGRGRAAERTSSLRPRPQRQDPAFGGNWPESGAPATSAGA